MGRISTSPRYMTDLTGPDPLSFVELEGGQSNTKKLEKNERFVNYKQVIRS